MRRAVGIGLGLTVLVMPATATASDFNPQGYHRCAGGYDPGGDVGGRFYRRIFARKVSCRTARSVTQAWTSESRLDGTDPPRRRQVVFDRLERRWTCFHRVVHPGGDLNPYGRIVCKRRSGQRVRFFGLS